MDAHPASDNVYFANCEESNYNQAFQFNAEDRSITHDGLCLDYDTSSQKVYMSSCHTGNNQKWYYVGFSKTVKTFHDTNKCLEWSNGRLFMTVCDSNRNEQKFEMPFHWPAIFQTQSVGGITDMFLIQDVIQIAKAIIQLQWYPSPAEKLTALQSSDNPKTREDLKNVIVIAIAGASSGDINLLINQESSNFIPGLKLWNDSGSKLNENGKSKRQSFCDSIKNGKTNASSDTINCMCESGDPYILCEMKLARDMINFQNTQQSGINLRHMEAVPDADGRGLLPLPSCEVQSNKDLSKLDVSKAISFCTESYFEAYGKCAFSMEPLPLSIEARLTINVPDLQSPDTRKDLAVGIRGDVCFSPAGLTEAFKSTFKPVQSALNFLGLNLCFLSAEIKIWPIREHADFSLSMTLLNMVNVKIGIAWQMGISSRETLKLCESNAKAICEERDNLFCLMDANKVVAYFEISLWFFLWEISFHLKFGDDSYKDCKTYEDGTHCFLGSSCNACINPATYWYGKAFTACGTEPKYPDGTRCLLGTSK